MKPRLILVALATVASMAGCNPDVRPAPAISGFTPKSGPEASTVTITGLNFSTNESEVEVRFNGVKAAVSASTQFSITTMVPTGATSGVITVTIGGQSDLSDTPFTLNPLIGTWRFTGSTATNCPNSAQDGASTCTLDCPTLTFSTSTILYTYPGGTYDFTYTLSGHVLTIIGTGVTFSPSYILAGGQLTLVYPPEGCSMTETYQKE